jgi:gamma-glutamylcyclotransferase (GGCT)/AIG2-like uncharacterized protein YtfP
MIERLFVYGTLAPGQPNEHLLDEIGGSWEDATVTGTLHPEGWGATMGYPAIVLGEYGDEVEGFLFSSDKLSDHWSRLDEFEGEAYERVLAVARLRDNSTVDAYVYALKGGHELGPCGRPG